MQSQSTLKFILMSIANYSFVMIGLLVSGYGLFTAATILVIAQMVLALLNAIAADTMKRHIILSVHLLIATILGDLAYAIAYYVRVDYGAGFVFADGESLLVEIIVIGVGCFVTFILSAFGIIIKNIYRAKK